jgi:lambda family phage portal protein
MAFTNTLKRAFGFAYEAAETTSRRRAIKVDARPEDAILDPKKRSKVISGARDLKRNLAIAAWAIRTHCAHVAQHSFQARTGIDALDDAIEARMAEWSRAENCDAAGRHPLYRLTYLTEMGRVNDGDAFLVMLSDGKLQAIESDRIVTPAQLPQGIKPESMVQGVQIDQAGRVLRYAVNRRTAKGKFTFDQMIDAGSVIQHGYFDRVDQVRGISPLAAAINSFLDLSEATEYALAKAKISQYLGVKIKRAAADALDAGKATEQAQGPINFGKGPVVFDLQNGDDAEFMTADSPGENFQQFMKYVTMTALKALDIDYSFFDSAHTNYSGARQALLLYHRSARIRQREVRDVLDRITRWKLAQWIKAGEIKLPTDLDEATLRWEWIPAGLGWIDPLKEIKANAAALDAALDSRQRIARERGEDWFEIVDQLASEQDYARRKGIVLSTDAANTLQDDPDPATPDKNNQEASP